MNTVYIDTHFKKLVLGLLKDGKLVDKKEFLSNKHSENTVRLLQELLKDNKLAAKDIEQVIVINGPGSFTGVRIGVVVAKVMGYTRNIKIKAISYLQALDLEYNRDITLGISDKNGVFGGSFNSRHELLKDYFYLSFDEIKKSNLDITILDDKDVDMELIFKYLEDKEEVNPHVLKPLYVKRIDVAND